MSNFYIQSNRTAITSLTQMILTCDGLVGNPTQSVAINDPNFTGLIYWGAPPQGDYVPANLVGLPYPSGGYN